MPKNSDEEVLTLLQKLCEQHHFTTLETFDFMTLARIYLRQTKESRGREVDAILGVEANAILGFANMVFGDSSDNDAYHNSSKEDVFITALLMGMGIGVDLQKERQNNADEG